MHLWSILPIINLLTIAVSLLTIKLSYRTRRKRQELKELSSLQHLLNSNIFDSSVPPPSTTSGVREPFKSYLGVAHAPGDSLLGYIDSEYDGTRLKRLQAGHDPEINRVVDLLLEATGFKPPGWDYKIEHLPQGMKMRLLIEYNDHLKSKEEVLAWYQRAFELTL